MEKTIEKISLWQLYIIIICFQVGSAALVGIGNDAKQDAWIAVIIATLIGVVIIRYYVYLLSKLPEKNLFEIFVYCFGNWIGKTIVLLYVIYFFYSSARVLRDFDELLASSIFEYTPIEVISITMMMVIIYMLHHGLEVLGRTSEVFFPYVITFILLIGLGIMLSGGMKLENLQPILGEGIGPIIKAIFPQLVTFPFGEAVAFTLILSYVGTQKGIGKVSIFAVLTSGFLLTYSNVLQIATLGAELKSRANFPLLNASREVSLFELIERVDLIIVFFVMFGIIVKVSIFFYGGLKGLELLTKKPYRSMTFSMGTIIAFVSIMISKNYREHIEEGLKIIPLYIHIPFQFVFPFIVLPFLLWKVKKKQKKESTT